MTEKEYGSSTGDFAFFTKTPNGQIEDFPLHNPSGLSPEHKTIQEYLYLISMLAFFKQGLSVDHDKSLRNPYKGLKSSILQERK